MHTQHHAIYTDETFVEVPTQAIALAVDVVVGRVVRAIGKIQLFAWCLCHVSRVHVSIKGPCVLACMRASVQAFTLECTLS